MSSYAPENVTGIGSIVALAEASVAPGLFRLIIDATARSELCQPEAKHFALRKEFGFKAATAPWSDKPILRLLPGMDNLLKQEISTGNRNQGTLMNSRQTLYSALAAYLKEVTDPPTWESVAALSLSELAPKFNERTARALAEMLFDVCLTGGLVTAEPLSPRVGSQKINQADSIRVPDLIQEVLTSLDARDLYIMQQRNFISPPRTLASIAEELEITRERVRQIANKVERRVTSLLKEGDAYRPIRAAAERFASLAGPIYPEDHAVIDAVWAEILNTDTPPESKEMLRWLAGPYEFKDGFWSDPKRWQQDQFDSKLATMIEGGSSFHDDITRLYLADGVNPAFVDALIASHPRLTRVLDCYIWGRVTMAKKATLALQQHGEPMRIEEIAAAIDLRGPINSFRNALAAAEDIHRIDLQHYGLAEWELGEYTGVSDALASAIDEAGGIAAISELVQKVADLTGARESTVRLYCQAPRFVVEGNRVRVRRESEPYVPDTQRLLTRSGVFAHGNKTSMLISVSSEDLRGSGRQLPDDIVFHLGAQLNERVIYAGEGFDINLTRPETSPENGSMGGLREALEKYGAEPGDEVRLDFFRSEMRVEVSLVRSSNFGHLNPEERIELLTGVVGEAGRDLLDGLDAALEFPLAGVKAMLSVRGDARVVAAIEELERRGG